MASGVYPMIIIIPLAYHIKIVMPSHKKTTPEVLGIPGGGKRRKRAFFPVMGKLYGNAPEIDSRPLLVRLVACLMQPEQSAFYLQEDVKQNKGPHRYKGDGQRPNFFLEIGHLLLRVHELFARFSLARERLRYLVPGR